MLRKNNPRRRQYRIYTREEIDHYAWQFFAEVMLKNEKRNPKNSRMFFLKKALVNSGKWKTPQIIMDV